MPNPTKAELKQKLSAAKERIAQLEEYIEKNKSRGKEAVNEGRSAQTPGKEFSMFDTQSRLQSKD